MQACRLCGATRAHLKTVWLQTNGGRNPPECTRVWARMGYRSIDKEYMPVDRETGLSGCLSQDVFCVSGSPAFTAYAQVDHRRRSHAHGVRFFVAEKE